MNNSSPKQLIIPKGNNFEVRDFQQRRQLLLNFRTILAHSSFRSLVAENNPMTQDMAIGHYQARPKKKNQDDEFYRVFGLYDTQSDTYVARHDRYIKAMSKFNVQLFSLDESIIRTVPTAVMVYFDARVRVDGEMVYIESSVSERSPEPAVLPAEVFQGKEPKLEKVSQHLAREVFTTQKDL